MWFERGEKKVLCCCFFPPLLFNPNYFSSNYPAGVYTFFSRTLWPCCGRSELRTHYRSCLPPKHTVKAPPPPPRSLSHKVAELICLQERWHLYCSSLSRCESTEPEPAASGLLPLFVPADSSGWFFCFSIHKLEFVIAKKNQNYSHSLLIYTTIITATGFCKS